MRGLDFVKLPRFGRLGGIREPKPEIALSSNPDIHHRAPGTTHRKGGPGAGIAQNCKITAIRGGGRRTHLLRGNTGHKKTKKREGKKNKEKKKQRQQEKKAKTNTKKKKKPQPPPLIRNSRRHSRSMTTAIDGDRATMRISGIPPQAIQAWLRNAPNAPDPSS